MKKSVNYALLLVIVVAAGALWFFTGSPKFANNNLNNQPGSQQVQEKPVTIKFDFSDQDDISVTYPYQTESLFAITQTIAKERNWTFNFKDYGEMGLLIEQIANNKNGDEQKYWQYFVDKEQPQVSVDKYFPPAGATVDWKFEPSQF